MLDRRVEHLELEANGIVVSGVELSPSAAAQLALLLARADEFALSAHVGRAVDHLRDHVELDSRDLPAVIAAIGDDPPANLAPLRAALLGRSSDRRPAYAKAGMISRS